MDSENPKQAYMTLTFPLPDTEEEASLALNAAKLYFDMNHFQDELRSIWKYGEYPEEVYLMVDKIYKLWGQHWGMWEEALS